MTHRAPVPVGPDDDAHKERLDAKRAFAEAAMALTDSALALDHAVDLVETIDTETLLRVFKNRRTRAKEELIDRGLANGFRLDKMDTGGTEQPRQMWKSLKDREADDRVVLSTVIAGESDTIETLEESRNSGLPPAVENVVGSAIEEIRNNLTLLETEVPGRI